MRPYLMSLTLVLFSMVMFACGGCGSSSSGDGGNPDAVAKLTIMTDGVAASTIVAPRTKPVTVTLDARTASGAPAPIDAAQVRWESSNPAFTIATSDGRVTISGTKDLFDLPGGEPETTVTVHYADKTATARALSVIDATGNWTATLDAGIVQKLSLTQRGRTITDSRLLVSGTINTDGLAISASGFTIKAKFISRDRAEGTYSGNGVDGAFVCTRDP